MLDGEIATEIDGIRRALSSSQLGRIAPHVTLVPPTNVDAELLAGAERVVREAAGQVEKDGFDVELGPAGTFPDNPSVLYLRVFTAPSLDRLRAALLAGPFAGRQHAARTFIPHVTLASGPSRHVDERMLQDFSGYARTLHVDAVTLLEQQESATGWVWAPVTSYALGPGGPFGVGGLEVRLAHGRLLSPAIRSLATSWGAMMPAAAADEHFVVASLGTDVAGVATWNVAPEVATLRAHVVEPGSRGLGIGTRLLSFVEHAERTNGRRALILDGLLASSAPGYYAGRGYRSEELVRRGPGDLPPLLRRLGSEPS